MTICKRGDEDDFDSNCLSDDLKDLINRYAGRTFSYSELSSVVTNIKMENDLCKLRFHRKFMDYCHNQVFIGELTELKTIIGIQMIPYGQDGSVALDDGGNPIECTSNPHDLGHILDIFNRRLSFYYIQCLIHLRPNANFNLQNLLFHFLHSSSKLPSTKKGIISGPTSVSLGSNETVYNVSIRCPSDCTCMWLLDDRVIVPQANSSVKLMFNEKNVGNRTLSYVKYIANKSTILASLSIIILCNSTQTTMSTNATSILSTTTPISSTTSALSEPTPTCNSCNINYTITQYNSSDVMGSCNQFCSSFEYVCNITANTTSCITSYDDGSEHAYLRRRRGSYRPRTFNLSNSGACSENPDYYCCCISIPSTNETRIASAK
ncbi:unnamed protein product [Adineta ricciae]|nr:unnamed protein product [Adineta ricciae]